MIRPHPFIGRLDGLCEFCMLADRDPIHFCKCSRCNEKAHYVAHFASGEGYFYCFAHYIEVTAETAAIRGITGIPEKGVRTAPLPVYVNILARLLANLLRGLKDTDQLTETLDHIADTGAMP